MTNQSNETPRKRGRQRNQGDTQAAPIPATGTGTVIPARDESSLLASPAGPSDAASLLVYQQRRLAEIRDDIAMLRGNTKAKPRDLATLRTAENACLKEISHLTGATKITKAVIVASDAWQGMFAELVSVLSQHPDAVLDLRRYLDGQKPEGTPVGGAA